MFLHVTDANYLGDYRVALTFSNGRHGTVDLVSALTGPMFTPLRDLNLFAAFSVDPELQTLVWPNGADLAPESLYFRAFRDDPALQCTFEGWGYLKPKAIA